MREKKKSEAYKRAKKKLEENIDNIIKARAQGTTINNIIKQLEISPKTFYSVLADNPELDKKLKFATDVMVREIKCQLYKLCFPHKLVTTKTYKKRDEITGHETVYIEKTEREVDGDIAAIQIMLKNNVDGWTDNPAEYKLKLKEVELKIRTAEETKGVQL